MEETRKSSVQSRVSKFVLNDKSPSRELELRVWPERLLFGTKSQLLRRLDRENVMMAGV